MKLGVRLLLSPLLTEDREEERQIEQARIESNKAERMKMELRFYELVEEDEKRRQPGVFQTLVKSFSRLLGGGERNREPPRVQTEARTRPQEAAPAPSAEMRTSTAKPSPPSTTPDGSTTAPSARHGRDEGRGR